MRQLCSDQGRAVPVVITGEQTADGRMSGSCSRYRCVPAPSVSPECCALAEGDRQFQLHFDELQLDLVSARLKKYTLSFELFASVHWGSRPVGDKSQIAHDQQRYTNSFPFAGQESNRFGKDQTPGQSADRTFPPIVQVLRLPRGIGFLMEGLCGGWATLNFAVSFFLPASRSRIASPE